MIVLIYSSHRFRGYMHDHPGLGVLSAARIAGSISFTGFAAAARIAALLEVV